MNFPKWKVKRDSYYYPLYQKYGYKYIENAGFFLDSSFENIDIKKQLIFYVLIFLNLTM